MIRRLLIKPIRCVNYWLFCLIDHSVWIFIHLVPGQVLIKVAKQRPWKTRSLKLVATKQELWRSRIIWLLWQRSRRASWGSTCLSRSLSGRILLDLIGVPNELHLGMNKYPDGRKVPHAWLADPKTKKVFTPGLSNGAGAPLTHF